MSSALAQALYTLSMRPMTPLAYWRCECALERHIHGGDRDTLTELIAVIALVCRPCVWLPCHGRHTSNLEHPANDCKMAVVAPGVEAAAGIIEASAGRRCRGCSLRRLSIGRCSSLSGVVAGGFIVLAKVLGKAAVQEAVFLARKHARAHHLQWRIQLTNKLHRWPRRHSVDNPRTSNQKSLCPDLQFVCTQ